MGRGGKTGGRAGGRAGNDRGKACFPLQLKISALRLSVVQGAQRNTATARLSMISTQHSIAQHTQHSTAWPALTQQALDGGREGLCNGDVHIQPLAIVLGCQLHTQNAVQRSATQAWGDQTGVMAESEGTQQVTVAEGVALVHHALHRTTTCAVVQSPGGVWRHKRAVACSTHPHCICAPRAVSQAALAARPEAHLAGAGGLLHAGLDAHVGGCDEHAVGLVALHKDGLQGRNK